MYKGLVLLFAVLASTASADSRVIRDNRLKDLGITPALGRGYSVATNTYQSLCMDKVVTTKPSYNFRYTFHEIEKDWEKTHSTAIDSSTSLSFLFLKANVTTHLDTSSTQKNHIHYMMANLAVDSYYNSVNEGQSTLSASAKALLEKGDTVGFFDACGPYYVRSIGRHSTFLALLSYRTKEETRDTNFELKLKTKLKSFFGGGGADYSQDHSFHNESREKQLTIHVWAYGLGKDHISELIPTDVDSFKRVVQDAIKAMQDADAGIVTSMEVVPWIENTEFQNTLKLQNTNDVLQYEQKKNLEANSELIAELDRIDRAQMDQYYKALNCRRILEDEYIGLTGDYAFDPELTLFQDIQAPRSESKYVSLAYLNQILSREKIDQLMAKNQEFLYGKGGNASEASGAVACFNELFKRGMDKVHYRNIKACEDARRWSVPVSPVLDHYCMPELGKILPKKDNK